MSEINATSLRMTGFLNCQINHVIVKPYSTMSSNSKVTCHICNSGNTSIAFEGVALKKYRFNMRSCQDCGFLYIDYPHWLAEAYASPIAACDTGLVSRNISLAERLQVLLFYLFGNDGTYLDVAGGTGLLVRLMRDQGYDFHWHDPYCKNIHASGFERKSEGPYTAVTAFEVLEHLEDPIPFLQDVFDTTSAKLLICSTELFQGDPPKQDWWYYSFTAGQHIAFYQAKTLELLATKLGLTFLSVNGLHFIAGDLIKDKIIKFYSSRIIRYISSKRMDKVLKSKTASDYSSIIGGGLFS